MMSVKLSILSVPTNRQILSVCPFVDQAPRPRLITKSKTVGFVGADKPTELVGLSVKYLRPRVITKSKTVGFVGADNPTELVGLSVCRSSIRRLD